MLKQAIRDARRSELAESGCGLVVLRAVKVKDQLRSVMQEAEGGKNRSCTRGRRDYGIGRCELSLFGFLEEEDVKLQVIPCLMQTTSTGRASATLFRSVWRMNGDNSRAVSPEDRGSMKRVVLS
jgi:hypothetical protein